jgi:hypothetical protein
VVPSPTTVGPTETTGSTESPESTETTESADDVAAEAANLDQGLAGDRSAVAPAVGWGSLAAAVALAAALIGRAWERRAVQHPRRRRRLLVYGLVSPVFLLVLYLCFENVDRVLPAF